MSSGSATPLRVSPVSCGGDWRGTVRGAWVRALWLAREDQSEPRRGGSFVVDQEEGECQRQKSASDRDMRRANRQMACERARHDERIGNGLRGSPSGRSAPPAPPCRSCLVVDLMDPSASMDLLALVDNRRAGANARPRRSGRQLPHGKPCAAVCHCVALSARRVSSGRGQHASSRSCPISPAHAHACHARAHALAHAHAQTTSTQLSCHLS